MVYPAYYSEVIAIGATTHDDILWSYSGRGRQLDLVAPSGRTNLLGNLWTTDITDSAGYNNRDPSILDYTDKMGGTSGACPVVAGVAALVLSVDPNLTNEQVEWVMERSALDLWNPGFDELYGHGRVDAKGALDLIPPPVVSEQIWVARYNGPGNNTDEAQAVAVDDFGNVYVTGYGYGSGTYYDYATVKYDPNGSELWVARYTWPEYGQDRAYALAVDNLGNVYVTGYSDGGTTNDDYATIKYDSNGNELWVARYNGPGSSDDKATALVVDDLGCVYVTGYSYGSGTLKDYATIKYDPNGNELWVARYDGPGSDQDHPADLALDNLGNVYVAGDSLHEYATIKYDSNGNEVWVARYNPGSGNVTAEALVLDHFGNVYVTGESDVWSSDTYFDYATIKYDPNGNELWVARYNGPANGKDKAEDLAVDYFGNVYVTGYSDDENERYDYATVKYDPNGSEMWVARYDGWNNSYDYGRAVVIDSVGYVYVTGTAQESEHAACTTIKYTPDGNQLWSAVYNGPGNAQNSGVRAMAIDNHDNIYITGGIEGIGSDLDYATIKYAPYNYCKSPLEGDLNNDCRVGFVDLAVLAENWLQGYDFEDFAIFADHWLEGTTP